MTDTTFSRPTRRAVLGTLAATAATPLILPNLLKGAPPSETIRVGFVGCGNQAIGLIKRLLANPHARIVAVCDVNEGSFGYKDSDHFYGREPAKKLVDATYAKAAKSGKAEPCTAYADFRELFARDDVDAVFLIVPDHWHTPMTILAAEAGKHIYCEKPLTLTVAEGREMEAAVKKAGVTLQCGSQERSNPISQFICEAAKAGAIGKITKVLTTIGYNNKVSPPPGWKPEPVPPTFDYAMWLGPAPAAPYHHDRCLYRFRFHYDYSGGQITNFGAHCNDMAQWGLGRDGTGPTTVECTAAKFPEPGSLFNTALESTVRCVYDDGVELICTSGEPSVQTRFEGENGWLQTGYGGTTASDAKLLADMPKVEKSDPGAHYHHMTNFIDVLRGTAKLAAPVEVGNSSAVLCHISNLAIRQFGAGSHGKYTWDPAGQTFTAGPDVAGINAMLARPRRSPWDKTA